ncbi:MAG TPA: sigma-54 dependent transcriptional regulator [Candidatus Methylomirabilis sp.]|nr:sigma-54 dependent transcriptional regulator [Candidatus Methylomirabilis sp.]
MPKLGRVLVMDDEVDMIENCARLLTRFGYEVVTEADGGKAATLYERERPDLVLTDLRMPGLDGLGVLQAIQAIDAEATVILITAFTTIETAVEAIKEGAFDYLPKPFSADQLKVCVERAMGQRRLREENRQLLEQLTETHRFDNIIGRSLPMLQVFETIKKVAKSEANILIIGETGTGKELIARSLHANSRRAAGPFIPVDCVSLPENLLESELFGHEKGAFTGAQATRPGLFEFASGGTIILDEVGDISLNLQAKLLRVLQERQVRRVGSNRIIEVDVRVISATNHDLAQAVATGGFREDLYYRLNVISLPLPPLRDRTGDIQLIAQHYLTKYAASSGKEVTGITSEAMRLLEAHNWPGNVRELQNVMERAVVLAEHELVRPQELPEQIRVKVEAVSTLSPNELPLKRAKEVWAGSFERDYLIQLLKRHDGNISQAAKAACVDRKTVHRLMKKYGLKLS